MHVHLPKALHGWRELAKEVGIIVLGVLIALGFEQLVQMWHWHEQVRTTRSALISEIGYSALWAEERIAAERCLRDRILHLTAELKDGNSNWTGDPAVLGEPRSPIGASIATGLPLVYRAPHRPWLSDEWQIAKSSGIIDHMDRDEARNLEFIYREITQLQSLQEEESSLEPQISFLSFSQALQPQSRVQALIALSRLDYLNAMQAQSSNQMLRIARSHRLALRQISIGPRTMTFEAARNQVVGALRERYGNCVAEPQEK
jgi:hypothetical protein